MMKCNTVKHQTENDECIQFDLREPTLNETDRLRQPDLNLQSANEYNSVCFGMDTNIQTYAQGHTNLLFNRQQSPVSSNVFTKLEIKTYLNLNSNKSYVRVV
jgi:hypothetical protein